MKHLIILALLTVTFPLFAQVETVRDKETKSDPLRPYPPVSGSYSGEKCGIERDIF